MTITPFLSFSSELPPCHPARGGTYVYPSYSSQAEFNGIQISISNVPDGKGKGDLVYNLGYRFPAEVARGSQCVLRPDISQFTSFEEACLYANDVLLPYLSGLDAFQHTETSLNTFQQTNSSANTLQQTDWTPEKQCPVCNNPLPTQKRRAFHYCSDNCRLKAFRQKNAALKPKPKRKTKPKTNTEKHYGDSGTVFHTPVQLSSTESLLSPSSTIGSFIELVSFFGGQSCV